MATQFTVPESR